MKKIFLFAIVGLLTSVAAFPQVRPRFVHEPDLRKILPKFLTPQGFLDPKFAEATARPSRYYTDFYGLQALAPTTREAIKRDFVPRFAEMVTEDENTLTLKFRDGYSAVFYPNASLKVMGVSVDRDHVEISGDDWRSLLKNLESFRSLVIGAGLAKRYLITNPHFKDEKTVARQLASGSKPFAPPVTTVADFAASKNGVLIYPEGVHGNVKGYEKLKADVLDRVRFDWIGMEMLTPSMQKDIDAFVRSADGSAEYTRSRKVLLEYFKDSWNGRSGPKTAPEDNYYFKIVEQMRTQGTRVIGIEKASPDYIFFRYGENRFGGAVRSLWWAQYTPKSGRGLVFGGSGHFSDADAINFPDLQLLLRPTTKMFVIEPIKIKQKS